MTSTKGNGNVKAWMVKTGLAIIVVVGSVLVFYFSMFAQVKDSVSALKETQSVEKLRVNTIASQVLKNNSTIAKMQTTDSLILSIVMKIDRKLDSVVIELRKD